MFPSLYPDQIPVLGWKKWNRIWSSDVVADTDGYLFPGTLVISDCMKEAWHVSNTLLTGRIEVRGCRKKVGWGAEDKLKEKYLSSLCICMHLIKCLWMCLDVHPCECMWSCFCHDGGLGVCASPGGCLLFMRWTGRWPSRQQQMGICFCCACVREGRREKSLITQQHRCTKTESSSPKSALVSERLYTHTETHPYACSVLLVCSHSGHSKTQWPRLLHVCGFKPAELAS